MPRQSRIDTPGALHHIICRGIERRKIFIDDSDRDDFVVRLGTILSQTSTRCYAWALIPNHFHLLLETGSAPVATVMSRLLTGYATRFNYRHHRHGYLFQNRYKSILCQAETYLLELVRYIHLNPLRAGIVSSLKDLGDYRYCGHSEILGQHQNGWMAAGDILLRFGEKTTSCRQAYKIFVSDGAALGKRRELTGGGLVRSAGGWRELQAARENGIFLKSDERILGDSEFVETVLRAADEELEMKSALKISGLDREKLFGIVAAALGVDLGEVRTPGRLPRRVEARSLYCYWAVRELGVTATSLAAEFHLSQPAISLAVKRGELLANQKGWQLKQFLGE